MEAVGSDDCNLDLLAVNRFHFFRTENSSDDFNFPADPVAGRIQRGFRHNHRMTERRLVHLGTVPIVQRKNDDGDPAEHMMSLDIDDPASEEDFFAHFFMWMAKDFRNGDPGIHPGPVLGRKRVGRTGRQQTQKESYRDEGPNPKKP